MTDDGLDPALDAYYDHEDRRVTSAIELIRVFQFKMPDGIGPLRRGPWPNHWWDEFWRKLEHEYPARRREFVWRWRERNQPGGRQADLPAYFEMDPHYCPYIRHGQQALDDYADAAPPPAEQADLEVFADA